MSKMKKNSYELLFDLWSIVKEYQRDPERTTDDAIAVLTSINYGIEKFLKDNNIKVEWSEELQQFIGVDRD